MSNSNNAPTVPPHPLNQSNDSEQARQYALFLEWQRERQNMAAAPPPPASTQWPGPASVSGLPAQYTAQNLPAHGNAVSLPPLNQPQQFQPPIPPSRYPTLAAAPAPPITPFSPIPVHAHGAPISSAPFNGIRSLGNGVARQVANSDRRASAAATIPRQPALQLRTPSSNRGRGLHRPAASTSTSTGAARRPRGSTVNPPHIIGVPDSELRIEDTLESVDHQDFKRSIIKVMAKIYAPLPPVDQFQIHPTGGVIRPQLVVYESFKESFDAELNRYGLIHNYNIPVSTNVVDFLRRVSNDLQASPFQYRFVNNYPMRTLAHERLELNILCLRNRGRINPRTEDTNVYLKTFTIRQNYTLQHLFSDEKLNNSKFCIDPTTRRWILHLKIVQDGFSARVAIPDNTPLRRHTCISRQIYHAFPYDNYQPAVGSEPPMCNGGDESDATDVEDVVMRMVGPPLTPSPSPSPPPAHRASIALPSQTHGNQGAPVANRAFVASQASGLNRDSGTGGPSGMANRLASFPSSIWTAGSEPWAPAAMSQSALPMKSFQDLTQAAYSQNVRVRGQEARFVLRGTDAQDLSEKFRAQLATAFLDNNFSNILARRRDFLIVNAQGETISIGGGIEDEVIHTAFKHYTYNKGLYFQPCAEDYSSLAIQYPGHTRRYLTDTLRSDMGVLGALTSLMMIRGSAPIPLSPALIQFFIHGCEIRSLHQEFVGEWYPYLRKTVVDWLALSHDDNGECLRAFQSHFSTWHDISLSTLQGRSEEAHKAWAVTMLQKPLLGPDPLHEEFSAFHQGFQLSCPNGFDATKLFKSYEGGTELLLSILWTSCIKNFDDIKEHLGFPAVPRPLLERTFAAPYIGIAETLGELIDGFLQGTGIPCPGLFSEAVNGQLLGAGLVDLSQADKPFFRPRLFCWAAMGTPLISDDARISVFLCDDNDYSYSESSSRQAMISEGKVSFRTCFGEVRIPASYLVQLGEKEYQAGSEPASLLAALHHWLLCECLNAIGGHSMM